MSIYYIGGSPCSGKSTVAEGLARKFGLYYFKVDDFLDKYIQMGASKGLENCAHANQLSPEQIWMRDPHIQCAEELAIYGEIFDFICSDIQRLDASDIITEGAAFLPHLMQKSGIPRNRYISITPTKEFQVSHYSQREWVPYVLEGCSDKDQAFANWMQRDALFARDVEAQCRESQYLSIVQDGSIPPDEIAQKAQTHFGLTLQ